ncbi:hypothetical protein ACLOJK_030412 [Asimina triloba]
MNEETFRFLNAWIYVSLQEYAVKDVLVNIAERFNAFSANEVHGIEKMKIDEMREKIYEHLKKKTHLRVIDDIWSNEAWDGMKDAFPDINSRSRLLLTTRNKDVALYAYLHPQSQPYVGGGSVLLGHGPDRD